jgi:hypothetical protein
VAEPRNLDQRTDDALAILGARHADLWLASSPGTTPAAAHLVPLSYAWTGEHVVVASPPNAVTTRNVIGSGRARLGLGGTRDVVMVDAVLDRSVTVDDADDELAGRYADQADWDPRTSGPGYVYLVLRPERIQVWREANELQGRTVMRNGRWLARSR